MPEPVKGGQQASCACCCLKGRNTPQKGEFKDKHGRESPFNMTKRLLEHPSNRFDEWAGILQRSQATFATPEIGKR